MIYFEAERLSVKVSDEAFLTVKALAALILVTAPFIAHYLLAR